VEVPDLGVHCVDCWDDPTCPGCWILEIDGPLGAFWWIRDTFNAQGAELVVDGKVVEHWIIYL
jgi:hypothetical protein